MITIMIQLWLIHNLNFKFDLNLQIDWSIEIQFNEKWNIETVKYRQKIWKFIVSSGSDFISYHHNQKDNDLWRSTDPKSSILILIFCVQNVQF